MALVSAGGRRRKVILLLVVLFAATHCEEESSDHTVEVEGKEEEEEGDVGNVDVTKMTLNEDEINLISSKFGVNSSLSKFSASTHTTLQLYSE